MSSPYRERAPHVCDERDYEIVGVPGTNLVHFRCSVCGARLELGPRDFWDVWFSALAALIRRL